MRWFSPSSLAFAITTRIKVMANLDIAERRLPQDGRIELMVVVTPSTCELACCQPCSARAWLCGSGPNCGKFVPGKSRYGRTNQD